MRDGAGNATDLPKRSTAARWHDGQISWEKAGALLIGLVSSRTGTHGVWLIVGNKVLEITKGASMIDTAGYIAPVNKAALQKTNLVIADAIGSNGEEFEAVSEKSG